MKSLDEEGFFISKDFAKSKINLINKEFDYLINSKNFSPRTGYTDNTSNKAYAKYIGDPGSSFLTVNFYELALEIINKIIENSSINVGDLQLSEIWAESFLLNSELPEHNDCIDYSANHFRAILYCNEVKMKNGPLFVFPKSHLWANKDDVPHFISSNIKSKLANKKKYCEVKKGDLLVFDSRLIHGRSSNFTKEKNRDITFEFYSKNHEKRIYSYSIPSIHLSRKVQEKIDVFSTPLKISEPNPVDPVAEKMYSALYTSRNGIYAMRFTFANFIYFSKIFLRWITIGIKKVIRKKIKSYLIIFK